MMDMEYNRTSPFISNCLHYSSEFHPYVGEFSYICKKSYVKLFIEVENLAMKKTDFANKPIAMISKIFEGDWSLG